MSGGSFNYLCNQSLSNGDLEQMADQLDEMAPNSAAAKETRALVDLLRRIDGDEALRGVWRAVEWWRSSDYSEDQAREAIAEYDQNTES